MVLDDEREEAITGLAVGGDWVVVATSTNMLRFFTAGQHHHGYDIPLKVIALIDPN